MAKKLNELMPDLKGAIKKGMINASKAVVQDLRNEGPFWSGDLYANWIVQEGPDPVENNLKGETMEDVPERRSRPTRPIPVPAPVDFQLEKGLAIGNRMQYVDFAADLKPQGDTFRYERPNADANSSPRWFTRYVQGGGLQARVQSEMDKERRANGF